MIHLKLGIHDIGLICIVLADVIESNEFVDNHELQKIHDKLKDSILYKINPDSEKNKNEIEFLRKDAVRKIENLIKDLKTKLVEIETDLKVFGLPKFNSIYNSCEQILQIHLKKLRE